MERHCIIEDFLKVPKECIEDTVIAKNIIADEGNLKTKDKNIFKDYIRQIKWCYNFSDRNVRIPKYNDEKRDYEEVQLFNMILKDENLSKISGANKYSEQYFKEDKKIERVVDILFRFVPYPIIIVVQYKKEIKLFVTHIYMETILLIYRYFLQQCQKFHHLPYQLPYNAPILIFQLILPL